MTIETALLVDPPEAIGPLAALLENQGWTMIDTIDVHHEAHRVFATPL